MSKNLVSIFMFIVLSIVPVKTVFAHVLVTDDSGEIGALLHVNPDDDPVAGKPSTLFFDIQNDAFLQNEYSFEVTITDKSNGSVEVPVTSTAVSASIEYIFPTQGTYTVQLRARPKDSSNKTYIFTHIQRVSSGVTSVLNEKISYIWAELLLFTCGSIALVLGVIFINKRKDIKTYSKL